MILTKSKAKIGPRDHGRKMSLKAFEFAQVENGWLCELARGYLVMTEVTYYYHGMQIMAIHAILGSKEMQIADSRIGERPPRRFVGIHSK